MDRRRDPEGAGPEAASESSSGLRADPPDSWSCGPPDGNAHFFTASIRDFRKDDSQESVPILGLGLMGVDGNAESDHPLEGAEPALQTVELRARLWLRLGLVSAQDEAAAVDRQLNARRIDTGQLELDHQIVAGLVDVDVRRPGPRGARIPFHLGEGLEQPVDLILDSIELEEGSEGFHGRAPGIRRLI